MSTTLVELGALASKSIANTSSASHGRRRAAGPAKTSISPAMYRAGGVAATLSLAVSGGAYAASQFGETGIAPLTESQARMHAIAASGADTTDALVVGGDVAEVSSVTEEATDKFGRVEQESDALAAGETKVQTEGVDGVTRVVYRVTSVDGKEVSREVVSRVVVSERVDEVVLVGTGAAASQSAEGGAGASDSETPKTTSGSGGSATGGSADNDSVWAALAQCESGGNPTTNTGNGYYGMYQFSLSTWQAMGGTGYPHEADAATQTAMAKKLQAQSGWGQWPHCAAQLGLL